MKSLSERAKKENEKLIDVLFELVGAEDKELTIEVNSMKTAVAFKNKLGKLISGAKDVFWKAGWSHDETELESLMGMLCLNPQRMIEVYGLLRFNKNKRHYDVDERGCIASVWFEVRDDDNKRYRKCIRWVANQATQTSKQKVKDELSALIVLIKKELGVSESYELQMPYINECSAVYGTEEFYKKQYDELKRRHEGEWMVERLSPCSEKQSKYVQECLGVTPEVASKLNKTQASELLSEYWDDCTNDKVIEYYKAMVIGL